MILARHKENCGVCQLSRTRSPNSSPDIPGRPKSVMRISIASSCMVSSSPPRRNVVNSRGESPADDGARGHPDQRAAAAVRGSRPYGEGRGARDLLPAGPYRHFSEARPMPLTMAGLIDAARWPIVGKIVALIYNFSFCLVARRSLKLLCVWRMITAATEIPLAGMERMHAVDTFPRRRGEYGA